MKVLEGYHEVAPLMLAAQAGTGDVKGAMANVELIEAPLEREGHMRGRWQAAAYAQIALAILPPVKPVSLADARPGAAKLDIVLDADGQPPFPQQYLRLNLPAKPELPQLIQQAQKAIIEGAGDNANLLAHIARLQMQAGEKEGFRQSIARAQQIAAAAGDPLARMESLLQIALALEAGGDAQGAKAAFLGCLNATDKIDARGNQMRALLDLVIRLAEMKEDALALEAAQYGWKVVGDLNDRWLRALATTMLAAAEAFDEAAQMDRFAPDQDTWLMVRLLRISHKRQRMPQVLQFFEKMKSPQRGDAEARFAEYLLQQGQADQAMAMVVAYPVQSRGSVFRKVIARIVDQGKHDDWGIGQYDQMAPERLEDAPLAPGDLSRRLLSRGYLNVAVGPLLVRKNRAGKLLEAYRANRELEMMYFQVPCRMAPAALQSGDEDGCQQMVAEIDRLLVKPSPRLTSLIPSGLAELARGTALAGDLAQAQRRVATVMTMQVNDSRQEIFEALVACGFPAHAIDISHWLDPADSLSLRADLYDRLLRAGDLAQVARLAQIPGEQAALAQALAMQARSGDGQGAMKRVASLDAIAWRGYMPYLFVAIGQGSLAAEQWADASLVRAPARLTFPANQPMAAATQPPQFDKNTLVPGSRDQRVVVGQGDPSTIAEWIVMLDHADAAKRFQAVNLLGTVKAPALPAIRRLGQLARSDPSSSVRHAATQAMEFWMLEIATGFGRTPVRLPDQPAVIGQSIGAFAIDRTVDRTMRRRVLDYLQRVVGQPAFDDAMCLELVKGVDDVDDGPLFAAEVARRWQRNKELSPLVKQLLDHHNGEVIEAMVKLIDPPSGSGPVPGHEGTLLLENKSPDLCRRGIQRVRNVSGGNSPADTRMKVLAALLKVLEREDVNLRARAAAAAAAMVQKEFMPDFAREHPAEAKIVAEAVKDADLATRLAAKSVARTLALAAAPGAPGAADESN